MHDFYQSYFKIQNLRFNFNGFIQLKWFINIQILLEFSIDCLKIFYPLIFTKHFYVLQMLNTHMRMLFWKQVAGDQRKQQGMFFFLIFDGGIYSLVFSTLSIWSNAKSPKAPKIDLV